MFELPAAYNLLKKGCMHQIVDVKRTKFRNKCEL